MTSDRLAPQPKPQMPQGSAARCGRWRPTIEEGVAVCVHTDRESRPRALETGA